MAGTAKPMIGGRSRQTLVLEEAKAWNTDIDVNLYWK